MKKFGRILSLVLIVVMIAGFNFVMADTEDFSGTDAFQLLETYPVDGAKETSMENMSVKIYFNKEMNAEVLGDANENNFVLTGPDGKTLPTKVLYAPKEDGVVLVLLDTQNLPEGFTVEGNSDYKLKISADVVDDAGDVLGKDTVITFTTQNQTRNGLVNALLMVVMTGGMIIFTMKGTKKKDEEEDKTKKKSGPVNPYKEAKKTGKSVAEVIEQDAKRKEKEAAKEARAAEKEAKMLAEYGYNEDDYAIEEYVEEGHYKVGKPRTVASAGSTYKTGRKAKYEAMLERKAKEEKWAREAKKKGKKK